MSEFRLITDIENYRAELESICAGSVPHFMEVEGRKPLSPFDDIYEVAPEIPKEFPVQCFAFLYEGEAAGYTWVMEVEPDDLYYILEFTVGEKFRRKKVGTLALKALDELYKKYTYSELLVSAKNFMGLNFWVQSGYTEITAVFPPEEQNTVAVEMNLRRTIDKHTETNK